MGESYGGGWYTYHLEAREIAQREVEPRGGTSSMLRRHEGEGAPRAQDLGTAGHGRQSRWQIRGGRVRGSRRALFGWAASAILAQRSGGDRLTTAFSMALSPGW